MFFYFLTNELIRYYRYLYVVYILIIVVLNLIKRSKSFFFLSIIYMEGEERRSMQLLKKYKYLLTTTLFALIIIMSIIIKINLNRNKELNIDNEIFSYEDEKVEENNLEYKVDIKGAILNPGVYIGNDNTRVIDIIDMAGGLIENSDITVINLSKKVFDEMVIIIYTKEEVEKMLNGEEINYDNIITDKEILFPDIKNDAVIEDSSASNNNDIKEENKNEEISIVNINTATIKELDNLPGIGPSKAQNIIDYRSINGNFGSIEEILNVNGIGTAIYEQIKTYITV